MKRWSKLAAIALAVGGAGQALAQHGHGVGHMATHDDLDRDVDHDAGMRAGHIPMTPAARIQNNAALATRLQPLVPAGTTIAADAQGFANLGQFIAALHVSQNLNIPFNRLKNLVTGNNAESLGKAIQQLEPNLTRAQAKADVKTARQQARQDIEATEHNEATMMTPAMRVQGNPALAARLAPLTPAGTNLAADAQGFTSLGQFIVALHVAQNLNIPFSQLKSLVTGTNAESLGQAVQRLEPNLTPAQVGADVRMACQQAALSS